MRVPDAPEPHSIAPRSIEAVHAHRGLTAPQLFRLLFEPRGRSLSTCQRVLRRLAEAGLLKRVNLSDLKNTPLLYLPTHTGMEYLANAHGVPASSLGWDRFMNSAKFIRKPHHRAINDIQIALTASAAREGFRVDLVCDEQAVKREHKRQKVRYEPDSVMTIARELDGAVLHFMLEADLGTEGPGAWKKKIRACERFYSSGKYEEMYETRDMRVLTVTTSPLRVERLKRCTEDAGGRIRHYFTTFDDATPAAFLTKPIWSVAGREALRPILT